MGAAVPRRRSATRAGGRQAWPQQPRAFYEAAAAHWYTYRTGWPRSSACRRLAMVNDDFAEYWTDSAALPISLMTATVERAQRHGYCVGDDPKLTAIALVSMLNQFCYSQLTGDGRADAVDDEACITHAGQCLLPDDLSQGDRTDMTRTPSSGTPGVTREFVGLSSPTARRAGSGGHPCQGLYHRGVGRKPKVAMIAVHYQIDFSEHYLADYMATRGIGFLGWNTRFRGFESSFMLDHALVDIGVGVRWLREVQGVETIVLLGNSGGGSLMAAYQAQAVDPHVDPLEGMRPAAGLTDLPAADGYVASAAHPGRPDVLTAWMDASVIDENDPIATDSESGSVRPEERPALQRDFIARYRSAQVARNNAITDWAERELKRVRARRLLRPPVHRPAHLGRSPDGRPDTGTEQASAEHVLRRHPGEGQPVGARHRRGLDAAQLARHVEPSARADPCRTASGPHRLPRAGDQRRAGHRRLPVRRPAHLRRAREQRQDAVLDRHRPLLHDAGCAQREGRYDRQVDRESGGAESTGPFRPRRQGAGFCCARGRLARHPLLRRG